LSLQSDQARRPLEVLLVEDDPGDTLMIREAFDQHDVIHSLHAVVDGVEAMEFLHKRGTYADKPRPDLILLDLNLPRKDGREVLKEVKGDPRLRAIPIVVLTTSDSDEDILRSYDLHANAYVTKPVDLERFMDVLLKTDEFFGNVAKLPRRG
jgi:CheY-like chemotaxis protein